MMAAMKRARLWGFDQVPDAVQARLVLLQREPYTGKWKRGHDPSDAHETGEEKAEVHGQRWVNQDRENRDYSVLRRKRSPEKPRRIE
jgi:hypothetical protein